MFGWPNGRGSGMASAPARAAGAAARHALHWRDRDQKYLLVPAPRAAALFALALAFIITALLCLRRSLLP